MPVKRLKQKTMKTSKTKKTKKTQKTKKTKKQTNKKSKSIMNSSTTTTVYSNMDSMYNNSNTHSSTFHNQKPTKYMNQQSLYDLITKISKERQNKTKSQTNLAARLMRMPSSKSNMSRISIMSKPKTYSKSVSSYYSTVMHNGETHNKGKKIVNESTNPNLEIDEMENGQVQHYMIPKNIIPYREPILEVLPMKKEPEIVLEYYPYSNQNKKYKIKSKKTTKTKKTKKTKK